MKCASSTELKDRTVLALQLQIVLVLQSERPEVFQIPFAKPVSDLELLSIS